MAQTMTSNWCKCPKCYKDTPKRGNPIFCVHCGTDIVRYVGGKRRKR